MVNFLNVKHFCGHTSDINISPNLQAASQRAQARGVAAPVVPKEVEVGVASTRKLLAFVQAAIPR